MRVLRENVHYRRLFCAQAVALAATGLTTVALGLLAYELASERASVVLGAALGIKMVAYVLVSPVVGAVADRVPRRRLMLVANLVRAGVVAALPWVSQIWQVFALVALLQAASATFTPVFQSALADVLPDEDDYVRALSLSQLATSLETVLSPVLAAAALAVTTFSSLFVATGCGFVASAALVAAVAVPAVRGRSTAGFASRLLVGIRLFRATPALRGLMALNLVVAATGTISLVTTVNVVRDLLGGDDSAVGMLLAASGAGTAIAAVAAPRVIARLAERTVMLGGGVVALLAVATAIVLAARPSWPLAVLAWVLVGLGPGVITVLVGRVLRRSTGPALLPALFSAQFSLSHACWLLTYPLAGWLAADAGFTVAWSLLAALVGAGLLLAVAVWPATGADVVRHQHGDDTDPTHLAQAHRGGAGWIHAHAVVVDEHHPHGPVPAGR